MKLHAYGPAGFIFSAQLEADPNDICGWAASVYDLAPVQQPHAVAAGHKTCRQSSRLARWACATCASSTSVFVVLPGCLERGFVWSSVQPSVWRRRSRVAPAASANKWPQPITPPNLPQSQMSSSKPPISHLFKAYHYAAIIIWYFSYVNSTCFRLFVEGTWVSGPLRAFTSALWASVLSIQPSLMAPTLEKRYTFHGIVCGRPVKPDYIWLKKPLFLFSVPCSCSNLTPDGFQSFLFDR